ncbi:MAG: HlyD family efflux transporter periplasmic adaptor subunit [Polyangiaceae bacterium]|nr:HlyD family efflux transporter periplasmic adaptor subunit [Polyangiaceae bacterium]
MRKKFILRVLFSLSFISLPACEDSTAEPESLQGIVELDERSIGFELPGRILKIGVERGDIVKKGTVYARLDSTLEEYNLDEHLGLASAEKAELALLYEGTRVEEIEKARARVKGTQSTVRARYLDYDRLKSLYADDSVSKSELDVARGVYESARALNEEAKQGLRQLQAGPREQEIEAGEARLVAAEAAADGSRERVRRHVLYAYDDAEVLDVPVKFGEYVVTGTTIVVVADTTHPYVDVFVPQGRVGEFQVGQPVSVHADTLAEPLGARVEHLGRAMEYSPRFLFSPDERPYLVLRMRVRIFDPERKIRAGIPAFVTQGAPAGAALPPAPADWGAAGRAGVDEPAAPPAAGEQQ